MCVLTHIGIFVYIWIFPKGKICCMRAFFSPLTLLHSERPKFYAISAFLSAIGLKTGVVYITELILGCRIVGFTHNLLLWPQISNCLRRKLRLMKKIGALRFFLCVFGFL